MRILTLIVAGIILSLGCARVKVEGSKEPIKIDISMRLDIYQHVQKDIDEIESIVSGSKQEGKTKNNQSRFSFVQNAYAQEGLSQEVEQAALRRKDRRGELSDWQAKGAVGENRSGLVEIRNQAEAGQALNELVKAENDDRLIIYSHLAKKNNTALAEIQKIYAQRLQDDAPIGAPIEVLSASSGTYEWKVK